MLKEIFELLSDWSGLEIQARFAPLLELQIHARMVQLGIDELSDYVDLLRKHDEQELRSLVSVVTNHHTSFFREQTHFEHLEKEALPALLTYLRAHALPGVRPVLSVLSAGCSTGEEAYSLSMLLSECLSRTAPDVDYRIVGIDIDDNSIAVAKNGVYPRRELNMIPGHYTLTRFWTAGTGEISEFFKAKPPIRRACEFRVGNILDLSRVLRGETFHVIFCRNVFIYFRPRTIETAMGQLLRYLQPKGLLFLGLSESVMQTHAPINRIGPSVFACTADAASQVVAPAIDPPAGAADVQATRFEIQSAPLVCVRGTAGSGPSARCAAYAAVIPVAATFGDPDGESLGVKQKVEELQLAVVTALGEGPVELEAKLVGPEEPLREMRKRLEAEFRFKAISEVNTDGVLHEAYLYDSTGRLRLRKLATESPVTESSGPILDKPEPPAHPGRKIRVLIVDDSKVIRLLLARIISESPFLEVVGQAERPSQVEAMIRGLKPDVMTLDIHMPEMNGVDLLESLLPKHAIPTVMVTSLSAEEGSLVLKALEVGAVDYIQKPSLQELQEIGDQIISKIRTAASAKVRPVRILPGLSVNPPVNSARSIRSTRSPSTVPASQVIAIGASTGGTDAIRRIFMNLPEEVPPIVVVQHMPPIFTHAFAEYLNRHSLIQVKEARDQDPLLPGQALIAPGGFQMEVHRTADGYRVRVFQGAPFNGHCPSVDVLFNSVAKTIGKRAIGVILTGMGDDGARGLLKMREAGARTLAQDEESCVVYGMPRSAVLLGAAQKTCALDDISNALSGWSDVRSATQSVA